jgi:FimV-like protein
MIAELRGRITELQQSLESQRSDSKATIQSLEERMSELQGELQEQRKLVAQQNAAMERLAEQSSGGNSGVPARDRYILWLLAGVNLLMLLAIIALWMRLRSVQSAPAAAEAAVGGGETVSSGGSTDPLTQANAQAAAGEFKQARSTLWDALAGDPQNWALYGRLLDLYEQEGDADQFEEVARRLFDQLGDQQPEWQEEIRTRGQRLKPDSPLFGAAAAAGGAAGAAAAPAFDFEGLDLESSEPAKGPASEESDESETDFQGASDESLEGPEEESFDLDFGDQDEESTAGEGSAEAAPSESPEEGLDLTFGEDEAEPASAPAEGVGEGAGSEEAGSGEAGIEEDEGLEFDLGIAEDSEEPQADSEAEPSPEADTEGTGEDDELVLSGWEADTGEEESAQGDDEGAGPGSTDNDLDLDLTEPDEGQATPGEGELDLDSLDWGESEEPADGTAEDGGSQEAEAEAPATATPADEEGGSGEDEGLDFELSGWGDEDEDLDEERAWSEEGPELEFGGEEGEEASSAAPDSTGESGSEGGQDEDEFEIKLDLAQAWIDMGDQESARGLLEEVQSRGGPQQQDRAKKMLDSLT